MNQHVTNAMLGVALVLTAMVAFELHGLKSNLDVLVRSGIDLTQYASAAWREVGGVQYTMRTYRDPNESASEFIDRHEAAVLAMSQRIGRKEPDRESKHEGR